MTRESAVPRTPELTERLSLRLTPQERDALERVADAEDRSVAWLVRAGIRQVVADRTGEATPA